MSNLALALMASATAGRVFAADARRLTRHLLRAGMRAGVAALAEDLQRAASAEPFPHLTRDRDEAA